jgi:hypothetical protein
MHTSNAVAAPGRLPLQPGQEREEPEQAYEDDIPSQDHDADGTQPGPGAQARDGDDGGRNAN